MILSFSHILAAFLLTLTTFLQALPTRTLDLPAAEPAKSEGRTTAVSLTSPQLLVWEDLPPYMEVTSDQGVYRYADKSP